MTTPKRTVSPAVKRALEAQAAKGHAATTVADHTLGDAIQADYEVVADWRPTDICLQALTTRDCRGNHRWVPNPIGSGDVPLRTTACR